MKKILAGLTAATLMGASASAATLDFSEAGSGFLGTTSVHITGATITGVNDATDLYAYSSGFTFCFIDSGNCEADGEIVFDTTVSNLTFYAGGYGAGDFADVSIYDSSNALLASITANADMLMDFSAYSGIAYILFDDYSANAGFNWGQFSFDVDGAAVPLPAALPLMAGGLGLMGAAARRRKKTV